MEESRGGFIAFLDADDLWVDDKLEIQMARFRIRPELQLCSGHIKSFWIPELDHERKKFEDHPYHQERSMLSPCTVLARRELFERIGGFDPALRNGEDTDWFIRMMRSGTAYESLPRLLVNRRQHTTNLTREVRPSQDRMLELLKRNLDRGRPK
jgi:GT2 family glycosyltransferase